MTPLDSIAEVHAECADGSDRQSVYLTFDDGPNPICTPEILDVLAAHGVPATFFVVGAFAADQPELIRRMISEGHVIGNHTMTHPDLSKCTPDEIQLEIFEANKAIRMACPQALVGHMRAPYGIWTEEVLTTLASARLAAVHWSVDPRDWSRPGVDATVDAVLASVGPGAIVLLHDGCPPDELRPGTLAGLRDQNVTVLSRLIPALHDRGFVFRSLPQHH
ncbi:chitooligosaccharide deacetylase NodB [Mesorhizobium amorphae]|uniref:chitooligosaccharide deacetylase NodB n=1 Tax=Mesorhizobium amorphae TaxID=71433 RepID=UPI00235B8C25|nr:chitooligosaccharide deacetylase NodB [Mesorhizobium amorphae]GLR46190.1 chitooligosaccharide deacetylase NodB [Mesorhizobium amorphae]